MLKSVTILWYQLLDLIAPHRENFTVIQKLTAEDIPSLPKSTPVSGHSYVHALFQYRDYRVRALIWELKYRHNTLHLETIGQLLYDEIPALMTDAILFDCDSKWILIPIPISRERRIERGYNQSEYIAKAIFMCDTSHTLLYAPQWLEKIKETPKQSRSHTRQERMKNLVGCFSANPQVENTYVILIDDVVTTGSTLAEARETLLGAGAKNVFAFTIAH